MILYEKNDASIVGHKNEDDALFLEFIAKWLHMDLALGMKVEIKDGEKDITDIFVNRDIINTFAKYLEIDEEELDKDFIASFLEWLDDIFSTEKEKISKEKIRKEAEYLFNKKRIMF